MSEAKRIVIVGGVAGGASAAARARRLSEDAKITLFERGEHISFANCGLPYHISGYIPDRDKLLVQTPEKFFARFRVDVNVQTEVVRIDRDKKQVVVRDLTAGEERTEPYDELILSPGAEPVRPPLPGIDSDRVFTLRNMADMDAIKKAIDAGVDRAVIVGGGFIGLEMAEAFRERSVAVSLVELMPQVMPQIDPDMAALLQNELAEHGVDLRLGTSVSGFEDGDDTLNVQLSSGETIECGMAMLSIGVKPEAGLARDAGLETGSLGGIVVDEHMRTSDPHILAVGDAVEVIDFVSGEPACIPLAGPANRQGRIAADNALGRDSSYNKTQGTSICKVFDLTVASTGMSEGRAKRAGMRHETVFIHPKSCAEYCPGASPLMLKMVFDPQDGKVLGAQAVGADGIDKRIDLMAMAVRAGLTVFDLEEQELSYAPHYGSAKDPINYAGFVAANVLRGDVGLCHADEMNAPEDGQALLDVRKAEELEGGTIPGSICVPLDELRERLDELPKEKELLVFCQVGLRGYIACRVLLQHGFKCRNFTGGYKTWLASTG